MENLNIIRYWIISFLVFYEFKVLLCLDCDFDNDFCDWNNDETCNVTWTRQHGNTPSAYTGPESDHTTGNGHYIYIEASDTRGYEEKARLISPAQESGPFCLIFWYSMYGQNIGSLHVYMRTNTSVDIPLFTKNHSMSTNKWIKAVISKIAPVDYQVILEGVGKGVKGDIAVDDISLTKEMCSAECAFEIGFCNWDQDRNDNFDWTRQSGKTQTPNTGPLADHTSGSNQTGYYIYIDTIYPREYGDKARLISPMQEPGSYCLIFWYCMYGPHINKLNVYIKTDACANTLLFSKENDTKIMDWRDSEISFQSAFEYQIIIEGVSGNGYQGDIAIDDVLLKAELCHTNIAIRIVTLSSCQPQTPNRNFTLETTAKTGEARLSTMIYSTTSPTNETMIGTNKTITTFVMPTALPGGNPSSTLTRKISSPTIRHSSTRKSTSETEHLNNATLIDVSNFTQSWKTDSGLTTESVLTAEHSDTTTEILNTKLLWNSSSSSTVKTITVADHSDTTTTLLWKSKSSSTVKPITEMGLTDKTTELFNTTSVLNTNSSSTVKPITKMGHSDKTTEIFNITSILNTNSSSTINPTTKAEYSDTADKINTTQVWNTDTSSSAKPVTETEYFDLTTADYNTNSGSTVKPVTEAEYFNTTKNIYLNTTHLLNTNSDATVTSIREADNASITTEMPNTTQERTKESEMKKSSHREVYIPIITTIIILAILLTLCILIRRWRRQKESISDDDLPVQLSPDATLPHGSDYTEVILENVFCKDDTDNIHSHTGQQEYVLCEDMHVYNHMKNVTDSFMDSSYSHLYSSPVASATKSYSDSNITNLYAANNTTQNQVFLSAQHHDCDDTYNKLQTSQLNSDKEALKQEDIEIDNESAYDSIVAGGKSHVKKTDTYSHLKKVKRSNDIGRDPSYLYSRVTKNVAFSGCKLQNENLNTSSVYTLEPNHMCASDNVIGQFALQDDYTECNTDFGENRLMRRTTT